jgi:hypothetical protein
MIKSIINNSKKYIKIYWCEKKKLTNNGVSTKTEQRK